MKSLILAVVMLLFSSIGFSKEIRVSVKGMVCAFCAQGITKKFKSQSEIESVDVSLEKKIVMLKTKEGSDLTDNVITKILTDSGYNIQKIDRQ